MDPVVSHCAGLEVPKKSGVRRQATPPHPACRSIPSRSRRKPPHGAARGATAGPMGTRWEEVGHSKGRPGETAVDFQVRHKAHEDFNR